MSELLTRLIIISTVIKFKKFVTDMFNNKHNLEVIPNVYSITHLSQNCVKNRKNIIILDVEDQSMLEPYLKSISQKYNVLIITLGNVDRTLPHQTYKKFIKRPDLNDAYSCKVFKNSLLNATDFYINQTPNMNLREMSNSVDEKDTIITIASSTGGTEALLQILQNVNGDCPPILIVQHMPTGFTKMYADRLDKICPMNVVEAANNDFLKKNTVFIAPAGQHMRLVKKGGKLCIECFVSERVHGVCPAADVLFQSIAPIMGRNAIGVILTGMGSDGAKGLFEMHLKGAYTIGQDEKSCVIYGMPKVAYEIGAIDIQLPLSQIADHLNSKIATIK